MSQPQQRHDRGTAARVLLGSLQVMGERRSNAVLEVLDGAATLHRGRKYPAQALLFADGRWRAYYHSHPAPGSGAREHGHFHLFTEHGGDWSHVAALAMDIEGQPLRWFATNRWVTDGPWAPRSRLLSAIRAVQAQHEEHALGAWLAGMLQLFATPLDTLLQQRDAGLGRPAAGIGLQQALEDRTRYELASLDIDFSDALQAALADAATESRS